jgi:hypothetical protein
MVPSTACEICVSSVLTRHTPELVRAFQLVKFPSEHQRPTMTEAGSRSPMRNDAHVNSVAVQSIPIH